MSEYDDDDTKIWIAFWAAAAVVILTVATMILFYSLHESNLKHQEFEMLNSRPSKLERP